LKKIQNSLGKLERNYEKFHIGSFSKHLMCDICFIYFLI